MFDSLEEQMRKDENRVTSSKERSALCVVRAGRGLVFGG